MAKSPIIQQGTVADVYSYPLHTHHKGAVSWGAIIGGAVGAISITLILLILGSGLGFASVSPWANRGASATTFTVAAAIWLIATQWIASLIGGYLTGRLRTRSVNVHDHESFFRDTAHGFVTWSIATLVTATVLASAVTSVISGGAKAGTAIVAAGAAGAGHEAAKDTKNDPNAYYVDTLFRSNKPSTSADDSRGEAGRILANDVANGNISDDDKARLNTVVARQTGISEQEAATRVDNTLAKIDEAKAQAKKAAEDARKAATALAITTALSMFLGAFIASAAAAYGGLLRDEHDNLQVK